MSEGSIATSGKIIDQWEVPPFDRDNDGSSYARVRRIGEKSRGRQWEKIVTDIPPMAAA